MVDCLIAAVAVRHDVPVLSKDRDFEAIAAHTPLLYGVLVQYVGHDPRTYTTDFVGYVAGNRAFYTQKKPAWHSAIRLVNER